MVVEKRTTTTTVTTEKTETTIATSSAVPANFMPIDLEKDPGAEEFYKANGIPVRSMEKFGKKRLYAIIPVDNYDNLSEEEKVASAEKAKAFSRNIDNHRRSSERVAARIARNENTSLDSVMASGYDPTLDVIDFAIDYKETVTTTETIEETSEIQFDEGEDASEDIGLSDSYSADDDYDYASSGTSSRGGYDTLSDDENPEYLVTKGLLYSELKRMVKELKGENLKIARAIMSGKSERTLAKELNISRTTLQGHRAKLMERFRKELGDFYID